MSGDGLRVEVGMEEERRVKVVVLGQTGVGKTSLITRLTHRMKSSPSPPTPTIGLDFSLCRIWLDDAWVHVNIWDTAGQERFQSLLPAYCRGAHGAILVFDLTDLRSFLDLHTCLLWAQETLPDHTCKLLVGNKKDLAERGGRAVTSWMGEEWATEEGAEYVELSMVDNSSDSLLSVFTSFLRHMKNTHPPPPPAPLPANTKSTVKHKCCM